jgi:hypothetical protein
MAARELWNIENNYTPGGGPVLADGHHANQVIDVETVTVSKRTGNGAHGVTRPTH